MIAETTIAEMMIGASCLACLFGPVSKPKLTYGPKRPFSGHNEDIAMAPPLESPESQDFVSFQHGQGHIVAVDTAAILANMALIDLLMDHDVVMTPDNESLPSTLTATDTEPDWELIDNLSTSEASEASDVGLNDE